MKPKSAFLSLNFLVLLVVHFRLSNHLRYHFGHKIA